MLILPDSSGSSRRLLEEAIADRFRITLLVIGDGNGEDVIASKADVRAQALSSTRRVVWVRDPEVLKPEEHDQYTRGGEAVVCVLDLDDRPAAWLGRDEANSFTALERAFLQAQQGSA